MKLHKTPQKQRNAYNYQFYDANGKPEPRITIQPGYNGVTLIDIKRLHACDDSEVYYNINALRPEEDEPTKLKKTAWQEQYISNFNTKYGYKPHEQDVADAVNEAFPKDWIASLDELLGDDSYGDKSSVLVGLCVSDDSEESPQVERLREIISNLSDKEQAVYQRVLIGGEKKKVVAADIGLSDVRVSQITKKIQALIAEDKILQKYFR